MRSHAMSLRGMLPAPRLAFFLLVGICILVGLALTTLMRAPASRDIARNHVSPVRPDAVSGVADGADFSARGITLGASAPESKQAVPGAAATPTSAPTVPSATQAQIPGAMVIRNGHVVVEVDSLEIAMDRVRRLAMSLGGSLGNVTMHTGEHQVRSATIELKVPAQRFDDALTGLSPLGKVEQSNSTAQDVGEEFVDLTARLTNARRLEDRLLDLLANRTGRLEDVLRVERELARVREEIERYEGRLRYLSARVATSTILASLHEREPLVAGTPGINPILDAFRDMWRNFVGFIALAIQSLGFLIPLVVLAWIGWRVSKRWTGQHRAAREPAPLRDTPA